MFGGLRAKGDKPDLALVLCDVDAISAGLPRFLIILTSFVEIILLELLKLSQEVILLKTS